MALHGIKESWLKKVLKFGAPTWIHNFCIHDAGQEQATTLVYAEQYAGKGPNEVLSCLDFYIQFLPAETTKLHIFADNCFSQNKNRYILAYLHAIANSRLDEVHLY